MARLGDAFSLIRNGANIKQGLDDFGYPITRIETISNRTVDRSKMGYAGVTDISKYADYVLQDGDILMSHINSETHLGKVAHYEKKEEETIIHGMNLLCLRPRKELVDSRYAFYYLSSEAFLRQIPRITKKSVNQASFNVAALKELIFPIPAMETQRTVVSILDKANELISLRKEQLAKLDQLVKSRFIELFGDPKSNNKEWKMNTFADICSVRQGLQIPISKRLTQYEDGCYEYITVAYLHSSKEREYIKNPKSTVICTKEDVLMTRTGNTGMVITDVAGVFHNNFFLIDFDRNRYNKVFLVEYLNLDLIQAEIKRRAGTSTIPDLNHGEFYAISIYEPPFELQNQFASFVEQTDKSKLAIQQSLDKLETLKKSLMQEYFG